MASSIHASSSPQLAKAEVGAVVAGALLSPLWFFTIGGVNLNPSDFILLFVSLLFVLRTGFLPYSLSRNTGAAVVVFLSIIGFSILWSSNKLGGLLSFAQYLFIFLGVVPIVSYKLQERSTRWQVFIAIWATTTGLTILGLTTYVLGDLSQIRDITLWYGNQNQFFWLVASSFLCNIAIALECSFPLGVRFGSAFLAAIEVWLIVRGKTLTAILMLGGGVWLFTMWLTQRRSKRAKIAFTIATAVAGVAGLVVVLRYWELIYLQGSLHVRIPQYTTAVHTGIQHFPLGVGIDSYYPSVHNFLLDYFVEIGVVGAGAFFALVIVWCRDVLLQSLRYPSRIEPFEFAFIAIFGTYVIAILFQPVPVRRFWWILFAASWAVVQDCLVASAMDM